MGEEYLRRRLEEMRRADRRRRATPFFHATPYRLRPGTHLRPRWSRWILEGGYYEEPPQVWFCTSLRAARVVARRIVEGGLWTGSNAGYAGHGERLPPDWEVHGAWIYRVRPTGPVGAAERGLASSTFPVRVLGLADTWGEPWRNRCRLPAALDDAEAARCWVRRGEDPERQAEDEFEEHWRCFRELLHLPRAKLIYRYVLSDWLFDRELRRNLLAIFLRVRDKEEAREGYYALLRRQAEAWQVRLRELRLRHHRRRLPDRRYRRREKHPQPPDD